MKIVYSSKSETVAYAAEELKKYLSLMMPEEELYAEWQSNIAKDNPTSISLGLFSELGIVCQEGDGFVCDTVDISVECGRGYIAGNSPRSVLQAAYAYLKSAGCLWVRPGDDGEYIPTVDMTKHSFVYRHTADYAFRGEVIEGAITPEQVIDTVRWLPKVGYNAYMLQFISPYSYFNRWYEHRLNPLKEKETVTEEQMNVFTLEIEREIKRLGIQLHSLGHGYLLAPFGIVSAGGKMGYNAPEEIKPYLAKVKGVRDFYQNSANYTHLCYSNPEARECAVEFLVGYLKEKPYIDYLHVWLADSFNNMCECENCRDTHPSDFYVMILNRLDQRLTEEGIDTKIVPACYVDTFWPPIKEKIKNPERFTVMVSMQRDHNIPLKADVMPPERLPVWERNKYRLKPTCDMILGFREAWREQLDTPTLSFDYDLYSTHFYDPAALRIARLMHEDIKAYPEMKLSGRLSCQTPRAAFPTALPNAILGETLTDRELDFDAYTDKYFTAAYGSEGKRVREYLEEVTRLFNPEQLRSNESVVAVDTASDLVKAKSGYVGNPEAQERLASIPAYIDGFMPTVENNPGVRVRVHRKSFELLRLHADFLKRYSKIFLLLSKGEKDQAQREASELHLWLSEREEQLFPYFDLYLFVRRLDIIVGYSGNKSDY